MYDISVASLTRVTLRLNLEAVEQPNYARISVFLSRCPALRTLEVSFSASPPGRADFSTVLEILHLPMLLRLTLDDVSTDAKVVRNFFQEHLALQTLYLHASPGFDLGTVTAGSFCSLSSFGQVI